MTMITPSYLGETIEYSSLHACRSTLEDPTGWYAVLRVPVTRSDEDLAIEILRRLSVLVHPGHFYDFPSDGHLIVSLITPPQGFHRGIPRVLELLNE